MSSDVLARATLLILAYLIAYMDRVNISFAAGQMNADLGFSATIYGLRAGVFVVLLTFREPAVIVVAYLARRAADVAAAVRGSPFPRATAP